MEQKKTPRANLESRKSTFFLMGLVVALSAVFTAFEWGKRDLVFNEIATVSTFIEEEEIEITPPEETPPPELPPPDTKVVADIINVVEDEVKVENQELLSVDDALNKVQEVTFTPPPASVRKVEQASEEIHDFVEEDPEFPGGNNKIRPWLASKLVYPQIAADNGIQGRVRVGFVVNKDGSIVDVHIVTGIEPSLDKEAMRVVKQMPKWKPGKQAGLPVRCRYEVTVIFQLQNA
ncbi:MULTISPECIES: energy transducer TonB [Porphyromonas]|uniref:Energy transducer TonB n=1 Tax=Porphyromonas canoris TaxID=36875 RepID=A0ABR4XLP8_9PORP|nr:MULTISPECIES: energy transducer TonB [Porphyromonas]KGL51831.1 energy transducer TonB [Porphyromonas canoris]KGN71865.1 energy transducer TonB [Porphyromonas sp. COT-108 OH1349]KGN92692.1 energy transducer TonB [Porphyromonas canoris]KGN94742.1 energy transducer TonB [Porphyromonas sp. COT-108 OH2963]